MDQQYEVGLRISTKSDDLGIHQSEQAMKNLGAATEKTTGIFGRLKQAAVEAGLALLAAFGAYKIIGWLLDGARAAMEQARALSQLSNMAKQFGQDGPAAAKAAEALGKALQAKGFQSEVIIGAVRDLIPLTKKYVEALSGATLAADISAKTGMQYGEALELIKNLIGGSDRGVIKAHRELGTAATTAQGTLDELRKTFGGSAAALDDNKQKVQSLKAQWEDFWKMLGGPVGSALAALTAGLRYIEIAVKTVAQAFSELAERARVAGVELYVIFHPSQFGGLKASLKLIENIEKVAEDARLERARAFRREMDELINPKTPKIPAGPITARPLGGVPGVAGGELDAAKIFNDQLFEQISALQKYYGKVRDLRAKHDKEEKDAIAANFRAVKDYYFKLEDVKQAEIELERRVQAAKAAAQEAAIQSAVGMLMAAFPKSKEIAAAEAVINTYVAATAALREGGPYLGPFLMAMIIAAGMAQVANIYATEPGSAPGGVGSKPGAPFGPPIAVTGAGAAPPPQGYGGVSTTTVTTNAPATTVINIDALDTTDALRAAQRALRPASRAYDRTLIGRGSVIVGSRRGR